MNFKHFFIEKANPNKYTKWYINIIENAVVRDDKTLAFRQRKAVLIEKFGYVEKHHIIPKAFGGSDDMENLVFLSAKEHFICHWLLSKMFCDYEKYIMLSAFSSMARRSKNHKGNRNLTAIQFSAIRRACAENCSRLIKEYIKENGHPRGMKDKTHSAETKERISNSLRGKMAGEKNPMFGTKYSRKERGEQWDEERKRKKSEEVKEFNRKFGNSNMDRTLYQFTNTITNEVEISTRFEYSTKHGYFGRFIGEIKKTGKWRHIVATIHT